MESRTNALQWGRNVVTAGARLNHFAAACFKLKKKSAQEAIVEENEDVGFWIDSIEAEVIDDTKAWYHSIEINNQLIRFKLDSGADLSLMSVESYNKLKPKPQLQDVNIVINSPGGKVQVIGSFTATSKYEGQSYQFKITVAKISNNLLSRAVSEAMGLLRRGPGVEEVYGTAGLMKTEPTSITLKDGAVPYKVNTPRRIPFPIMKNVEEELKRMEQEGIITKLTSETTDWCAPMCPVMKPNGKVRVTVDFKRLNQNVKRPNLMLCNLDDIAPQLSGSKWFSALDVASGFYQLPLAPESALLTTFITPFGRYHFNRVPMGINIGPEEFQRKMNEVLSGLDGVSAIMDDILVHGKTLEEHDERLARVMKRIENSGLKLNRSKCFIRKALHQAQRRSKRSSICHLPRT
jgi:hypothetical protein